MNSEDMKRTRLEYQIQGDRPRWLGRWRVLPSFIGEWIWWRLKALYKRTRLRLGIYQEQTQIHLPIYTDIQIRLSDMEWDLNDNDKFDIIHMKHDRWCDEDRKTKTFICYSLEQVQEARKMAERGDTIFFDEGPYQDQDMVIEERTGVTT